MAESPSDQSVGVGDEYDREGDAEFDENRLDFGSGLPDGEAEPVSCGIGPLSPAAELRWSELEGRHVTDSTDGTVELRLNNLADGAFVASIKIVRSSGVEYETEVLQDMDVAAGASASLTVELLPDGLDLGQVATSMNVRVSAAVVSDGGVETDGVLLGHYQTPPLYFHREATGSYKVYNEAGLISEFGAGLIDSDVVEPGNEITVDEGEALAGVVVVRVAE